MSRPTEYIIAEALARNPPFEGSWTTVYFYAGKDFRQVGWRHDNVLLMAVFNKDTGRHCRTHLFKPDGMPPSTIGFNELLERLVTE